MLTTFTTLFNQVFELFLLMGIGYALNKAKMIDDNGSSQLTQLLCYVISPGVILYAFQMKFSAGMFTNFLIVGGATVVVNVGSIIVSHSFFNKKTVPDPDKRSVLRFASVYSNCGFMGYPVLQALEGTNGLFYGSAFNSVFNLFVWTHGMLLYSGKLDKKSILKAIANPNILALVVGILLFRFSIVLPGPVSTTVKYISQLNTPISMIVIGTAITKIPFKKIFTGGLLWVGVLIRNLVLPFIMLFLLHALGVKGELLLCCVVLSACPAAGLTVLFAKLTGKDEIFPGKLMTLSTILSLITLPLIVTVLKVLKF
jgi:malate permease and related proteins